MSKIDGLIQEHCPEGAEHVYLGYITSEHTARNKDRSILDVRSVTNSSGLVRTEDFFDNTRTSADTSNYKKVEPGMIVYNPSRINVGSIARNLEAVQVIVSPMYVVVSIDSNKIDPDYLDYFLSSQKGKQQILGGVEVGARFRFTYQAFARIRIPLPPIEVQKEIVNILDKFTQLEAELSVELEARRRQYEFYRNQLLTFDESSVPFSELGDLYKFQYGMGNTIPTTGGDYSVYGSNGIVGSHHKYNSENAPVIGHIGAYAGIVNWGEGKHFVTYNGVICKIKSGVDDRFGYYLLMKQNLRDLAKDGSQPFVSYDKLNSVRVQIPDIATQRKIAKILDSFDKLVNDISEGLPAEIAARRKQYEYYRTKLLTFKEIA